MRQAHFLGFGTTRFHKNELGSLKIYINSFRELYPRSPHFKPSRSGYTNAVSVTTLEIKVAAWGHLAASVMP